MHIDTKDPKNADLEIQSLQIGKMLLQIDKLERLHYRTARGIDRTVQLLRSDEVLIELLDAGLRGSGEKPATPPPDRTRLEPPSNLVHPSDVNSTLHERQREHARYGRAVEALANEEANPR